MRLLPLFVIGATLAGGCFAACGGSPAGAIASGVGGAGDSGHDLADANGVFGAEGGIDTTDGGDAGGEDAAPEATTLDAGNDDDAAADAGIDAYVDANGPPFPCGPSLVCYEITQFCGQVTGPHGGTFWDCNDAPDACAGTLSCACLLGQGIVSPCSEEDGGITVVATEPP